MGALPGEGLRRAPLTGAPRAPHIPLPAPSLPSPPAPILATGAGADTPPPRRRGEDFGVGGGLVVVSLLVLYSSLLQPVRSRPAASPARATLPRPPCSERARMLQPPRPETQSKEEKQRGDACNGRSRRRPGQVPPAESSARCPWSVPRAGASQASAAQSPSPRRPSSSSSSSCTIVGSFCSWRGSSEAGHRVGTASARSPAVAFLASKINVT